ncbi:hypothetical protein KDD17_09170 [Sulfitobacter albidus]|uniref:Uncharacterized protein n=1 Tax=Sulfitobacter albidus TaxID=2829501 RepID=A0A975JBR5_9RHOB|nr:hypothetical protein [Sulfitobacter albidus]QUJ75195.1 hypothetical protein KDD17_09170 [Sulfitobacter albidus]
MFRFAPILVALTLAVPATAQTAKQTDCGYQADVVAAVQAARIDRVGERKVAAHIGGTDTAWPDKYDAVIPLVTPWVYQMKMSEVRSSDLGAAWKEVCLSQ